MNQEQLIAFYSDASNAWRATYETTKKIEALARTGVSLEHMADMTLVLKKSLEKLDDARKEMNAAISLMEKISCLKWIQRGDGESIHGELCTATPRSGTAPPCLKRRDDPERFDAVMTYFGFSKEMAEKEMARLHWPSVEAHLSELHAQGRPLPACLKGLELQSTWGLTCRQASGVDLDELALAHQRRNEEHE